MARTRARTGLPSDPESARTLRQSARPSSGPIRPVPNGLASNGLTSNGLASNGFASNRPVSRRSALKGPAPAGLPPRTLSAKATSRTGGNSRPSLLNSAPIGRVGRVPPRSLSRKRRSSRYAPILRHGIQLLIVGLGIAAIGGTLLKMWPSPDPAETTQVVRSEPKPSARKFPLTLTREVPELKAALQELPNLYPGLTPKIFYADVDTGEYISTEGSATIAAASTIKLPILLAFFEAVDAGRIDPNRQVAVQPTQVAPGSGDMQLLAPGTQFTALEVASQMIINSDNTATNMMIDLLGGQDVLNSWFQSQGLEKTQLSAPLPDLAGTNTTSARDLAHTMLLISQGEDLQMRSRDRVLNILNRTYNKSLLASGPMDQGALTYNKTGDIESVLGDVALIDLPNGKRYVVAILVERPSNDGRAQELIRRVSSQIYEEAAKAVQPAITPSDSPADADTSEDATSPDIPVSGEVPADEPYADEAYTDEAYTDETYIEAPYPSANPQDAL